MLNGLLSNTLCLGIPYQFMMWIIACLTTMSYSFTVSGELSGPFEAREGLRQGDRISPCLFFLCKEYLHKFLLSLWNNPRFSFHPRFKKLASWVVRKIFALY